MKYLLLLSVWFSVCFASSAWAEPGQKNYIASWDVYYEEQFGFPDETVKARIRGKPSSYILILECANKAPSLRLGSSITQHQEFNSYYDIQLDERSDRYKLDGVFIRPWEITFRQLSLRPVPDDVESKRRFEQSVKDENSNLNALFKGAIRSDYATIRHLSVDDKGREEELWNVRFSLKKFKSVFREVQPTCEMQSVN